MQTSPELRQLAADAQAPATSPATSPGNAPAASPGFRLLALAFAVFNALRTLAYLPTILSIAESGQSDQHSLFTWFTWFGANATMAAWVYQHNGRQFDRVVVVNVANALLCGATGWVIVAYRF